MSENYGYICKPCNRTFGHKGKCDLCKRPLTRLEDTDDHDMEAINYFHEVMERGVPNG